MCLQWGGGVQENCPCISVGSWVSRELSMCFQWGGGFQENCPCVFSGEVGFKRSVMCFQWGGGFQEHDVAAGVGKEPHDPEDGGH